MLHISVAQILSEIKYKVQRKNLLKNDFQIFPFKNNVDWQSKTQDIESYSIKIAYQKIGNVLLTNLSHFKPINANEARKRNTYPLFFRHHVEFFALKWLILNSKPWITLPMYAYMRQELVSRLTSKVTQCTFFELRTTSLLYFFSSLFKGGFCWGYTVENLLMISFAVFSAC